MPPKISSDMEGIFRLLKLTHKFTQVRRRTKIVARKETENDAEHSYQLALMAWYLADKLKLKINHERLLKYAIAHDLVEAYVGDTDFFLDSRAYINSKSKREKVASRKLNLEFKDFTDLSKIIFQYDRKADSEARLVYLVDKILPILNTWLIKDKYYSQNRVTFRKWDEWLESKKAITKGRLDPKLSKLLAEVRRYLQDKGDSFFTPDSKK